MGHVSEILFLKIEIDGHFHGGEAPKPWVAHITGTSPKYGLAREFLKPMNDWKDAHKACSGNVYGVVSHFALREGNLYEVSRCRGRSSKRYVAREFGVVRGRKLVTVDAIEALALAEGHSDAVNEFKLPDEEACPRVSEVLGLGTPRPMGFVVQDGIRRYRMRLGCVYELLGAEDSRRFVLSTDKGVAPVSENGAMDLLRATA
jgi:hypothetical protein